MLVNPLFLSPSTKYMTVPNIIQSTKTKDRKTAILILLLLSALPKLVLSPIKRVSFKILKTLSSLRARRASKEFVPTTKREMYFGTVERKSTMP